MIFQGMIGPFFFMPSPASGHADCFYLLAVVSNATANICVQVYFWVFSSFVRCCWRSSRTGMESLVPSPCHHTGVTADGTTVQPLPGTQAPPGSWESPGWVNFLIGPLCPWKATLPETRSTLLVTSLCLSPFPWKPSILYSSPELLFAKMTGCLIQESLNKANKSFKTYSDNLCFSTIPRSGMSGSYGNCFFVWGATGPCLPELYCFSFALTVKILIFYIIVDTCYYLFYSNHPNGWQSDISTCGFLF